MIRSGLGALVACAALALPAASMAATVGVEEVAGEPNEAKLNFVPAPGEANRLTVSIVGEEGLFYDLELVDTAVPIEAGPGCSGGGTVGVAVRCRVRKPNLGDNYSCFKGCHYTPGTKWTLSLNIRLGDGGSRLYTTALPEGAAVPQEQWTKAPILVVVTPGAGDDIVLTGPGRDLIQPSPGADLIRTGEGGDELLGGPGADGPDDVDLGGDPYDAIDYSERAEGVRYEPNGLADDGAASEGDNLGVAETVRSGSGADVLVGSDVSGYGVRFSGEDGDDTITGSIGGDELWGGRGDDELIGLAGDDYLSEPFDDEEGSGNDTGSGGAGNDEIRLGEGDDEALGGVGDDRIEPGEGDDRAAGGPGGDRIQLGPGGDWATGGADGDLLLGEAGADEIHGGVGEDRLSGDAGRDSLFGGGGDDRVAVGVVVTKSWGLREFLESPGPLEGKPDRVVCGSGLDGVKVGPGDAARGCESTLRAGLFEVRGVEAATQHFPTRIKFTIRRPGTVRLGGGDVEPRKRVRYRAEATSFDLWPVGAALDTLRRDGQVKLRLRLSFQPKNGRKIVRFLTVHLWLTVDLKDRAPL